MTEKYNGWVNYETWLMALNLSNDEGTYNAVVDLMRENKDKDIYDKGELLRNFVDNKIDWAEIVKSYDEDIKE